VDSPRRDLLVSPGHALLIDGLLVQAGALVNGTSVIVECGMPSVFAYYHVECDTHVATKPEMNFDNWAERTPLADGRELPYSRVKSARQLPPHLRRRLAARAFGLCARLVAA
jgi:hypothetical protein